MRPFSAMVESLLSESDSGPATKCKWIKSGFCKLDGRPCPFTNENYMECQKFKLSVTNPAAAQRLADQFEEQYVASGEVHD